MPKKSKGSRKSGTTTFEDLKIPSSLSPDVLVIKEDQSCFFILVKSAKQSNENKKKSAIINIPTLSENYNPFWIKVIY